MTREEVLTKYGLSAIIGLCELCMYKRTCKDISNDFNPEKNCNGPYSRYDD